jgi:SAM-dependent methyltransferase
MQVDLVTFDSRAARTEYVVERFRGHLNGRVLDVGCDQSRLRQLCPDLEYTGIDVGGTPDIQLDLERADKLPFRSGAFDSVMCCDVLEHIDNLHCIFEELVRVTRRSLIISLPNCWAGARQPLGRGRGSIGHYGLPPTPPADRHKWFFSLSEAHTFLTDQAERHGLEVVAVCAVEKLRPALTRALRRLRYPNRLHYLNRYAHTLFVVFEKR